MQCSKRGKELYFFFNRVIEHILVETDVGTPNWTPLIQPLAA